MVVVVDTHGVAVTKSCGLKKVIVSMFGHIATFDLIYQAKFCGIEVKVQLRSFDDYALVFK